MIQSSIDTDAALGTILGNFNAEYIKHVVDDSLLMKFRPFLDEMPNIPDILDRDYKLIKANAPDYVDQVQDSRLETYKEIIDIICKFYGLSFRGDYSSMTDGEVYGIARTMYDIFISKFTIYMIEFFVKYIKDNAQSIYDYLLNDPNSNKSKDATGYNNKNYIDPKYLLIHSNINMVIYNLAAYDIDFPTILRYTTDPNTAILLSNLLEPIGDVYKNNYASYIMDPNTSSQLITAIKLKVQATTLDFSNN